MYSDIETYTYSYIYLPTHIGDQEWEIEQQLYPTSGDHSKPDNGSIELVQPGHNDRHNLSRNQGLEPNRVR